MRKLTQDDCLTCMREGEFAPEVRGKAERVAILMTQSWCPQWQRMRTFLEPFPESEESAVYYVEYDKEPFFREFMDFKESAFSNDLVPYLRYYLKGELSSSGNYADRIEFMERLGLKA